VKLPQMPCRFIGSRAPIPGVRGTTMEPPGATFANVPSPDGSGACLFPLITSATFECRDRPSGQGLLKGAKLSAFEGIGGPALRLALRALGNSFGLAPGYAR
jgi:hypothetical protein